MANSQLNGFLCHLRRVVRPRDTEELTDGQLLERFLAAREEAAFEELLRRHGPMVLGVCRRVLSGLHDAEDAFQATFLVLVRKGASVVARESVGNWLYGVAYRTAQKARAASARRQAKEKKMARPEALPEPDDRWGALRPLIDQELSRLPDKYRAPIVLCDLEGQTRKEAARRLGCPEGTISGRLARARLMLGKRLARHGLALPAGAVTLALAQNAASASVPALLTGSTIRAAVLVAAGHAAAGAVSAPVAALTEGVLKAMSLSKLKLVLAVVLAVGLIGAGWRAYYTQAAPVGNKANKVTPDGTRAKGEPANGEEKINLPKGPAPIQVLASIDKDGKLVIKMAIMTLRAGGFGGGGPNGGPGGNARVEQVTKVHSQTYDLDDVQVLDTKAKKLDKKKVMKLLKKETVALAALWGQKVDPLHLRVIKDGTLVFVLPAPKGNGGNNIPGGGLPGRPAGGGGAGGGRIAPPGERVPGIGGGAAPPVQDPNKP
jgi:RNA polymerase sigma factor (sigma-70 family)